MTGFEAIDTAVHRVARGAEVLHALDPMRKIPYASGGPPLYSVAVYASDSDRPHWHYVTYGLSALGESEVLDEDAFSFEFSMRVARGDEKNPPQWPVLLLRGLARYVREVGTPVVPGDTFGNGAPITHASGHNPYDETSGLTEFLFGLDPELETVETEVGPVMFVQAFGLYEDEFLAAQRWSGERVWALFAESNALMVTDPWRADRAEDPAFAERVDQGITEEGSSLGATTVPGLSWEPHPDGDAVAINLHPAFLDEFCQMLEGRTAHGRDFFASSERHVNGETVLVQAGEEAGWRVDETNGYLVTVLEPSVVGGLVEQLRANPTGYVDVDDSGVRLWIAASD